MRVPVTVPVVVFVGSIERVGEDVIVALRVLLTDPVAEGVAVVVIVCAAERVVVRDTAAVTVVVGLVDLAADFVLVRVVVIDGVPVAVPF